MHCRYLPVAFRLNVQCMRPVQLDEGSTEDAEDILSWMPSLSLSSPFGLAAHFHHDTDEGCEHMQELLAVQPTLPLHDHKIVFAHHNSIMVPGVDLEHLSKRYTPSLG